MSETQRRLFRVSLCFFPADFRRAYSDEMEEIFARRVAALAGSAAWRVTVREVLDVAFAATRLRLGARRHLRPAVVSGIAVMIAAGTVLLQDGGWQRVGLAALQTDSIDFSATDPAGEFTLSIRKGRPVAATIDRRPVPPTRLVHAGDSIRFLAPSGGVVLAVAYYRDRARIEWEARSEACRGQAASCVQYQ